MSNDTKIFLGENLDKYINKVTSEGTISTISFSVCEIIKDASKNEPVTTDPIGSLPIIIV